MLALLLKLHERKIKVVYSYNVAKLDGHRERFPPGQMALKIYQYMKSKGLKTEANMLRRISEEVWGHSVGL